MNCRVLVVEDDPLVIAPIEEALTQAGFECAITASAAEAEALLVQPCNEFRTLLTDINIRGAVDGWELAKRARAINPDLPVIYMSGTKAHLWALRGVPDSLIFSKPASLELLVRAVIQCTGCDNSHEG